MKKNIIIAVIGVLFIASLVFGIIVKFNVSEFEKTLILNNSNNIEYLEEVDIEGEVKEDAYIAYALEYSYNFNDKSELSAKEIMNIVKDVFNVDIKEEEINKVGITPLLLNKNITYDIEKNVFSINKENLTYADIAEIDVVKYVVKSIKKSGKKLIVEYNKYVVDNPYDIYNYHSDQEETTVNTNELNEYLKHNGKITVMKNAITDDYIEAKLKVNKTVKVEYIIKDNKLLINSIK